MATPDPASSAVNTDMVIVRLVDMGHDKGG